MEKADIKELSVSLLPNMMDVVFFPSSKSICLFLGHGAWGFRHLSMIYDTVKEDYQSGDEKWLQKQNKD